MGDYCQIANNASDDIATFLQAVFLATEVFRNIVDANNRVVIN